MSDSFNDSNHTIETPGIQIPTPEGAKSRVSTDLDFESDGKQITHLKIPYSRNNSAWGRILIPIAQVKNGTGPTMLMTAGVHGDEFEGTIALTKIIQRIKPEQIQGRLIIIPALNLPAHLSSTRLSPLDHKDLNRSFPGAKKGSITEVIAHYVDSVLIPKSDVVFDMHSGGTSLDFTPCVVMHNLSDKELQARTLEALKAHGAPYGLILTEGDPDGLLDTAAEEKGKIFLSTEFRGGATVSREAVEIADNGVCNLLRHFGIADLKVSKYTRYRSKETRQLLHTEHESCFIGSPDNGLFEPLIELGQAVKKGDHVAQLHHVQSLSRRPKILKSEHDGVLMCQRVPGRVEAGDCLAVIGIEMNWSDTRSMSAFQDPL